MQSVLTFITKSGNNLESLTNWPPLSLLNIDYKIATKDIANIIKKELPPIISPSQTGFIGGRFIGENIWTTLYCIQYLKDKN